jgi:hypothetical protein
MLPWQVVDAQEPGPVYLPAASSDFAVAGDELARFCEKASSGKIEAKIARIARRIGTFTVRECAALSLVVIFRLAGRSRAAESAKKLNRRIFILPTST